MGNLWKSSFAAHFLFGVSKDRRVPSPTGWRYCSHVISQFFSRLEAGLSERSKAWMGSKTMALELDQVV